MEEALAAIRVAMSEEDGRDKKPNASPEEPVAKLPVDAGLLSSNATAAIGSAFGRLTEVAKKQGPTLEDLAREMLRPMLKSWLDENLPRIVETMVQAEIERATRGR